MGRWVDIARLWVVAEDAGVRILGGQALFMFRPLLSETALFLFVVVHPLITRLLVCFFFPHISLDDGAGLKNSVLAIAMHTADYPLVLVLFSVHRSFA